MRGTKQTKDCRILVSHLITLFRIPPTGKKKKEEKKWILNICEYLAKSGIQIDPSISERSIQSGKKHLLCRLRLLFMIIREREQSDPENANHGKDLLANEHTE